MKWIVWGLLGLLSLVAVVWLVGSFLPVAHTAQMSRVVEGDPERVWAVVTDIEGFPAWRPGVDAAERLPDRDGLPVWRERGAQGAMTMQVVESSPPRRLVTQIADEGLPFGGTWTYQLAPSAGGTRVTLTEDGEVYNPFFRFMARFVFGHTATMESYLDGLTARMAGEGV